MRKYLLILLSFILIIGSGWVYFSFSNDRQKRKGKIPKSKVQVEIQRVKNSITPLIISATGRVEASQRLNIYAQVQGIMQKTEKPFRSGIYYKKGELIVKINKEIAATNFLSQKADFYNLLLSSMSDIRIDYKNVYTKWQRYVSKINLQTLEISTLPKVESEKEKSFLAARKVFSAYYNLKSQQIKLEQYKIYAPFDGMLSQVLIREGSLIRSGQELGTFISHRDFQVKVFLAARYLPFLKEGQDIRAKKIESTNESTVYKGNIKRINRSIDLNTQTFEVTLRVFGKDLVQGLYMSLEIEALPQQYSFEVDRGLLIDGNYLYTVESNKLYKRKITPVVFGKETLIFRGLPDSTLLVTSRLSKAYDGMLVEIRATEE